MPSRLFHTSSLLDSPEYPLRVNFLSIIGVMTHTSAWVRAEDLTNYTYRPRVIAALDWWPHPYLAKIPS